MSESGDDEFADLDAGLAALREQSDEIPASGDEFGELDASPDALIAKSDELETSDGAWPAYDEQFQPLGEDIHEEMPPKLRADPPPDWLVRLLDGGNPLGQTDTDYHWWTPPHLDFAVEPEGVRLTTTAAGFAAGRTWVPEAGRWYIGEFTPDGNSLHGHMNFKNLREPVVVNDVYDHVHVTYDLDDNAVGQITVGEQEHCADFQRAFELSYKALEVAVTAITNQVFASKRAAIDALVESLVGSGRAALVPENPVNLANWTNRLGTVALALERQTKKRDTERDHSTEGFTTKVTRDGRDIDVTLTSIFNNPHRPASDIVRLEGIETVYTGGDFESESEPAARATNSTVSLVASIKSHASAVVNDVAALKGSGEDAELVAAIRADMDTLAADGRTLLKMASQPDNDHLFQSAEGVDQASSYTAAVLASHHESLNATSLADVKKATKLLAGWVATLT